MPVRVAVVLLPVGPRRLQAPAAAGPLRQALPYPNRNPSLPHHALRQGLAARAQKGKLYKLQNQQHALAAENALLRLRTETELGRAALDDLLRRMAGGAQARRRPGGHCSRRGAAGCTWLPGMRGGAGLQGWLRTPPAAGC